MDGLGGLGVLVRVVAWRGDGLGGRGDVASSTTSEGRAWPQSSSKGPLAPVVGVIVLLRGQVLFHVRSQHGSAGSRAVLSHARYYHPTRRRREGFDGRLRGALLLQHFDKRLRGLVREVVPYQDLARFQCEAVEVQQCSAHWTFRRV